MALPVVGLFIAGLTARGNLVEWLQNLEGSGRFEAVFFRTVSLLGGPVMVRRLPAEARNALNDLVSKSPNDAELYRMRARADEAQLDFTAAEADWQRYAQLAPIRSMANSSLPTSTTGACARWTRSRRWPPRRRGLLRPRINCWLPISSGPGKRSSASSR